MDPQGGCSPPSELKSLTGVMGVGKIDFKCNIQIIGCFIEASIRFFGKNKQKLD